MSVPVSRFVITDDRGGRFVPILEARLSSLLLQAHGGREPEWSNGVSGTQAVVLRSGERLNLNISPTSISAAKIVATALKKATDRMDDEPPKLSRSKLIREESTNQSNARRPSVAAFVVRNELGMPISMRLPGQSSWTSILHDTEVEVGAQSETLISSEDEKTKSRDAALQCSISIPSFVPHDLSASEAGKHPIMFYPLADLALPDQSLFNLDVDFKLSPMEILWDVELINGLPLCRVRSTYRLVNDTKMKLDVSVLQPNEKVVTEPFDGFENMVTLEPGEAFPIPVHDLRKNVHVRPVIPPSNDFMNTFNKEIRPFQWSPSLPSIKSLEYFVKSNLSSRNQSTSSNSRRISALA